MTAGVQRLTIRTFGGVSASLPCRTLVRFQTNRARALLLYLVTGHGRLVHRETVTAALWPDTDETAGRAQLRKTLWRLRSALEGHGPPVLRQAEAQIGLETGAVAADLWQLGDAVAAFDRMGGSGETARGLMDVLSTLTGQFGAGLFDPWCVEIGRLVEQDRLAAVERVVGFLQREGRFHEAVHWANLGLELDSLAEQLHRALMECHLSMGDAPSALRQYHICLALLADSLGIAPSPETQAVRDLVCAARGGPSGARSDLCPCGRRIRQGRTGREVGSRRREPDHEAGLPRDAR